MKPDLPTTGRRFAACTAILLLGLALSGCGRRGPLEPAVDAAAAPAAAAPASPATPVERRLRPTRSGVSQAAAPSTALATRPSAVVEDTPGEDEDEADTLQSVIPSPNPTSRRRTRPYVVPTEPFILDPLL